MKTGCELLGFVLHLASIVAVWWFAGWGPWAIFILLNLSAGFFYCIAKRID